MHYEFVPHLHSPEYFKNEACLSRPVPPMSNLHINKNQPLCQRSISNSIFLTDEGEESTLLFLYWLPEFVEYRIHIYNSLLNLQFS